MVLAVRTDPTLRELLEKREYAGVQADFIRTVDEFLHKFGAISLAISKDRHKERIPEGLVALILEMTDHPQPSAGARDMHGSELRDEFLSRFSGDEKENIVQLLDLARTSYRLRDDDNIYLGRIERQLHVAADAGRERLKLRGLTAVDVPIPGEIAHALRDRSYVPKSADPDDAPSEHFTMKARQLVGQPAGPGVARGPARVIMNPSDLAGFKRGEILVCDAVDPTMTFVVPLAAGVVERRGGMLIHGAIIAREYGLACVTGVPKATVFIKTGDCLTVDGYLGIVTVG
jgi:phosphohistidine swiveling domain-containing protein